jgi:uncharacterized membrane protein YkvA (DUF1232 family)
MAGAVAFIQSVYPDGALQDFHLPVKRRPQGAAGGGSDLARSHRYKATMSLRPDTTWPRLQLGMRGLRFLRHLPHFVRLYWQLFRDYRVSVWPKALLLLSIIYVLSPLDFIPDVIPFIGEVDDLLVLIVACRLFIYLCPPEVVREHVRRIDAGG